MSGYHISDPHLVQQLLTTLLGKEVSTADSEPVSLASAAAVGVYRDEQGKAHAACACDLHFAAYASAALTMIPVGAAQDTIQTGTLTDDERANLHELMNVCVGFFNRGDVARIRLTELCDHDGLPQDVAALYDSPHKADILAEIDGYGAGRLSLRCG